MRLNIFRSHRVSKGFTVPWVPVGSLPGAFFPQAELARRGSTAVLFKEWLRSVRRPVRGCVRQLWSLFAVLGEGRARLACAKHSVAPLLTEKLHGFGTFSL